MAEETASMSPDDSMQFDSVGKRIALEKNIADEIVQYVKMKIGANNGQK